jgi:hypothetical protein
MPNTIHSNGQPPPVKKIRNFEDFKTWLQRNGRITLFVFGILAGSWAAKIQAEQTAIRVEGENLRQSAEVIATALENKNQRDDKRWADFMTRWDQFQQMVTDRLARIEERQR